MVRLTLALLLSAAAWGQVRPLWPIVQSYTVATLPTFGVKNRIAFVTDAASIASCTAGGGAVVVLCRDDGTAWAPAGDGTSAGGGYTTVSDEGISLTQRAVLNFTGAGVTCIDNAGSARTDCTITSGGGGLADPGVNGVVVRTALNTTTARTLTGTASQVTVTNGDGVAGNPTLSLPSTINVNTSGSAATLTTPRAIYGNNFDGSAALTQIIASTFGGTGNGFTKFSGPTTAEKTFTLPDSNATLLYSGGAAGTPSSITLTNATGLPLTTGVTGSLPGANMDAMVGDSGAGGTKGAVPAPAAGDAAASKFLKADGTWAVPAGGGGSGCTTSGSATQVLTDNGAGGCSSNAAFLYTAGTATLGTAGSVVGALAFKNATSGTISLKPTTGALGTTDWTFLAGSSTTVGVTAVSNVTAQSTSQGTVTVATSPAAGQYQIKYIANQNALCTTGNGLVVFAFNWTDAGNARTLTTGPLWMSTAQQTSGYVSGTIPIYVASGNVTYTSTVTACDSGTASYDVHVALERLQ